MTIVMVALGPPLRGMAPFVLGGFVGLALVDLLLSQRRLGEVEARAPAEVFVGDRFDIVLRVANAPSDLSLKMSWPEGLAGPQERDFQSGGDITLPVNAVRRGVWNVDEIWLIWKTKLGLFDLTPKTTLPISMRVVPNIRRVQSGEISTTVRSSLYGVKLNDAIGDGSEFHQLRDFVAGMDVGSIDWKRSARSRSLLAKELRAERNHNVIFAFDNGYLMSQEIEGSPRIDHAVTAALAVAWAAAIGGDRVGYYAYDVTPGAFYPPEAGRAAFARMRSWSADLDYVARETNHTLALTALNAKTPKRSLIIVFTDFVDATSAELLVENTRALAKRHLIVFVALRDTALDRLVDAPPSSLDGAATTVAANQTLAERRLVLERLTRLGVTVVDARPQDVTSRLVTTYLQIKARELI